MNPEEMAPNPEARTKLGAHRRMAFEMPRSEYMADEEAMYETDLRNQREALASLYQINMPPDTQPSR